MLCQKCHKNLASVRYAEVVDGKVNDIHLCQECLNQQQSDVKTGFELSSPAPLAKRQKVTSALSEAAASTQTCRACETDLKTIVKTGKVGCSVCYQTFPAQLESVLEGIHVGLTHRGKTLRYDDQRARLRAELQTKRALMKSALNAENYEEAASLRDEIRSLETGIIAPDRGGN